MKKKLSVYLRNKNESPSAYYCVMQYIKGISEFDGHIHGLWPDALFRVFMKPVFRHGAGNIFRKAVLLIVGYFNTLFSFVSDNVFYRPDIVLVCREVFTNKMPFGFERMYKKLLGKKKVIWIFDDNISQGEISKKEWEILCEYATEIMVTHDYLKKTLPEKCQSRVSYIPQADGDVSKQKIQKYEKERKMTYSRSINLVYIATSSNLPNLHYIAKSLDKAAKEMFLKNGKELRLNVVCNEPFQFQAEYLRINNITWTREKGVEWIAKSHIGIMPLIDNEYNRGKGGFKLIQYMTGALPVIASNVGWNGHVVGNEAGILIDDTETTDEWTNAVIRLATDWDIWESYSKSAEDRCARQFSYSENLKVWKKKFELI